MQQYPQQGQPQQQWPQAQPQHQPQPQPQQQWPQAQPQQQWPQAQPQQQWPQAQPQQPAQPQPQFGQPAQPITDAAAIAALAARLNDASATNSGGRYLNEAGLGTYVWDVTECKLISGRNGPAFTMKVRIIETDNPSVRPGDEYDIYCDLAGKYDYGRNECKLFVCERMRQLLSSTPNATDPGADWDLPSKYVPNQNNGADYMTAMTTPGSDNKMIGSRWKHVCYERPSRRDPSKMVKRNTYTPIPPDTALGLAPAPAPAPAPAFTPPQQPIQPQPVQFGQQPVQPQPVAWPPGLPQP